MPLVAAAPNWGALGCVGRGALLFLFVGVSTTLANSRYMALPQIEARPTSQGLRTRTLTPLPGWEDGGGDDRRVSPTGCILQSNRSALPPPPPFEVGKVGFAGPARPRASPAEGVPRGPSVLHANKVLGHARLQARFTYLPDKHVRFLARSHHEGVGPLAYLVRLPRQGSRGVSLFPSFAILEPDSPQKHNICHLDSGHLPDGQKAYPGKGCEGPEEGSVHRLGHVLDEDDQPSWRIV